jgi:hypothetical protein
LSTWCSRCSSSVKRFSPTNATERIAVRWKKRECRQQQEKQRKATDGRPNSSRRPTSPQQPQPQPQKHAPSQQRSKRSRVCQSASDTPRYNHYCNYRPGKYSNRDHLLHMLSQAVESALPLVTWSRGEPPWIFELLRQPQPALLSGSGWVATTGFTVSVKCVKCASEVRFVRIKCALMYFTKCARSAPGTLEVR